ncbi:MAG: 30S ribosomal protein S12 methylthiotransferase RimO [Anaerolineales bacterium]|nr:30S ribosomal protein S12 methylthiotransferase RimO [Anaerolineales bacterium]
MKSKTFHLVSLGCAKNTVDSESMGQLLVKSGYRFEQDQARAEILIVNTCGFIGPAKAESLEVLGELAASKKDGQVLIAAGCLTQRYGAEVVQQVPGIDGILGTRRWMDIVDVVKKLRVRKHPEPLYHLPGSASVGTDERGTLRAAIQGASAYIKIADGCRRPCAFCAIPLIKGGAVSRPREIILDEARHLQSLGVRELILIAQDTTDFGHDLGERDGLAQLLDEMATVLENSSNAEDSVGGVEWIRIMYAFPGYVTDRLIDVMATHSKIIPYLDIPLQHAHPKVLRRMKRPANVDWVYRTLDKMRMAMPDLAIRTTFIVGYPGETEQEFQSLLDFVEEIHFDRVGAFEFSFEPGTTSESLGDPISPEIKRERWEKLMALQQGISLEKNQALVGKRLDVLVEGTGDGISLARSYRDAPEIDGLVIVEGEISVGSFVPVNITGAMAYDLSGVVAHDHPTVALEDGKNIQINEEGS